MSKLDELIKEFCPDGVEYKKIKDVAQISAGGDLPKNYLKGQKVPTAQYPYPIYSNGTEDGALYGFSDDYRIEKEAVTISARGTIGNHEVRAGRFTPIVRLITMIADESKLTTKFLNYALYGAGIGGITTGIPSLTVPMLEKSAIPVPPLPIQREIVRILDNFTVLTAELAAELAARKKQYEYYRNQLLTFGEDNEWHMLGDLFEIRNGYTPSKNVPKYWENGTVPWFRMEDIRVQGRILSDAIQHVTPQAVKGGKLFPANSIIISTTATIGEHALVTVEALTNQQITCLTIKSLYKDKLIVKFAFYYCYILAEWCKKNVNFGGGLPIINSSKLKNFAFPIPNIEEQERIVTILDRFDTLCNDSTTGLPAEIEARKKQYDYYRDKLLTFPEANS